jgi:hypothetical protein
VANPWQCLFARSKKIVSPEKNDMRDSFLCLSLFSNLFYEISYLFFCACGPGFIYNC